MFAGTPAEIVEQYRNNIQDILLTVRNVEVPTIAAKIAVRPPQALRLTKRLLRRGVHTTLEQTMENAAAYQSLCHFTEDHMEALSAMFEKRKSVFKGK